MQMQMVQCQTLSIRWLQVYVPLQLQWKIKKIAELRESQLTEAKDRETMHVAQLMEKDNTILNQQLDLLRADEKNRELEERLRQTEEASRTTVNQLWETRIKMAKEELRDEMRNLCLPRYMMRIRGSLLRLQPPYLKCRWMTNANSMKFGNAWLFCITLYSKSKAYLYISRKN